MLNQFAQKHKIAARAEWLNLFIQKRGRPCNLSAPISNQHWYLCHEVHVLPSLWIRGPTDLRSQPKGQSTNLDLPALCCPCRAKHRVEMPRWTQTAKSNRQHRRENVSIQPDIVPCRYRRREHTHRRISQNERSCANTRAETTNAKMQTYCTHSACCPWIRIFSEHRKHTCHRSS